MYVDYHPKHVFGSFDNSVCYSKAPEISLRCLVRCVYYICTSTPKNNSERKSFCHKCRLARVFINLLHCRRHLFKLYIIAKYDPLMTDRYIVDLFRKLNQ